MKANCIFETDTSLTTKKMSPGFPSPWNFEALSKDPAIYSHFTGVGVFRRFSISGSQQGDFASQGISCSIWRHFCLPLDGWGWWRCYWHPVDRAQGSWRTSYSVQPAHNKEFFGPKGQSCRG